MAAPSPSNPSLKLSYPSLPPGIHIPNLPPIPPLTTLVTLTLPAPLQHLKNLYPPPSSSSAPTLHLQITLTPVSTSHYPSSSLDLNAVREEKRRIKNLRRLDTPGPIKPENYTRDKAFDTLGLDEEEQLKRAGYVNKNFKDLKVLRSFEGESMREGNDSLRASVCTVLGIKVSDKFQNYGTSSDYLELIKNDHPSASKIRIEFVGERECGVEEYKLESPDSQSPSEESPSNLNLIVGRNVVFRGISPRYSGGHVVVMTVVRLENDRVYLQNFFDPHKSSQFCPLGSGKWIMTFSADVKEQDTWIVSCLEYKPIKHLIGYYNKMERNLPQSPWIIGGKRKAAGSVSEEIEGLLGFKKGGIGNVKFHGSGREDYDVRMLGERGGRKFCLKIQDCELEERGLEDRVGGRVEVKGLRWGGEEDWKRLQEETESKVKYYKCIIHCSTPILSTPSFPPTPFKIYQKTPLRVLHRRANLTRERGIVFLILKKINEYYAEVEVGTEAGAYIKEFVTGDFGRTRPNLGELLGGRCDILQLDVVGIEE